jgi:hypothetical protein
MCRTRLKPHGRRFDPVPAHHIRPGQRARGRDYPVRVAPDSGMVPAWPLGITTTRGWVPPPGHSPVTGVMPTLPRYAATRLTARSRSAGPRASRSQSDSDRWCGCGDGTGLGRQVCFPRAMCSPLESGLVLLTGCVLQRSTSDTIKSRTPSCKSSHPRSLRGGNRAEAPWHISLAHHPGTSAHLPGGDVHLLNCSTNPTCSLVR